MQHESHKTRIGVIRDHVNAWRKAEGWSREAAAMAIVEAHLAIGAPARTGIHFDSTSGDAFTTAKTHADRIFRWLDDETKDTNFMPANFEDSILAAMPMKRRMACIDDMYRPLGVVSRCIDGTAGADLDVHAHLCAVIKEDSESHQALADIMADGSSCTLERAHKEVSESIEAKMRVRSALEGALSRVGKVLHIGKAA